MYKGGEIMFDKLPVGFGSLINVWKHNWIPSSTNFKPFVIKTIEFPDLKVENFIDNQSKTWNMDVIQNILHPIDIRGITQIEIPIEETEDKMIWIPDKKRKFQCEINLYILCKINGS